MTEEIRTEKENTEKTGDELSTTEIENPGGSNEMTMTIQGPGMETILNVVDPNIQDMFIEPTAHSGTEIGALLSRCVLPVQMGVFDIPEKLLEKIESIGKAGEQMLPGYIMSIRQEIIRFKVISASQAFGMISDDKTDMFVADAVKMAPEIISDFLDSVKSVCRDMGVIQRQYASEGAFFMSQSLGGKREIPIEPQVISTPLQDQVIRLNRTSSGIGGYLILALLKSIDRVGKFLSDKTILKLFGVPDALTMLNTLDYRIMPEQILFHQDLKNLMRTVSSWDKNKQISKDDLIILILLCERIRKHLDK